MHNSESDSVLPKFRNSDQRKEAFLFSPDATGNRQESGLIDNTIPSVSPTSLPHHIGNSSSNITLMHPVEDRELVQVPENSKTLNRQCSDSMPVNKGRLYRLANTLRRANSAASAFSKFKRIDSLGSKKVNALDNGEVQAQERNEQEKQKLYESIV
jgi:hypothetical protein